LLVFFARHPGESRDHVLRHSAKSQKLDSGLTSSAVVKLFAGMTSKGDDERKRNQFVPLRNAAIRSSIGG
jgi:hypothetical protein